MLSIWTCEGRLGGQAREKSGGWPWSLALGPWGRFASFLEIVKDSTLGKSCQSPNSELLLEPDILRCGHSTWTQALGTLR